MDDRDGKADRFEKYGNQAELKVKYSGVALLVRIPSFARRTPSGTSSQPIALDD